MSDIFLSYASADRERVRPLVRALERHGWSVWWDRTILPGRTFDQAIEEALGAVRCMIVMWSQHSVNSDWVKTEAAEGARGGFSSRSSSMRYVSRWSFGGFRRRACSIGMRLAHPQSLTR